LISLLVAALNPVLLSRVPLPLVTIHRIVAILVVDLSGSPETLSVAGITAPTEKMIAATSQQLEP
jgi:hypothetical protein